MLTKQGYPVQVCPDCHCRFVRAQDSNRNSRYAYCYTCNVKRDAARFNERNSEKESKTDAS